jgi:hypothetical protein
MQTSEEENMKVWKLLENTCVVCIKLYEKKNKKDPLEKEYNTRLDFWKRYIEAKLTTGVCYDKQRFIELKRNLIEEAKQDLEPLSRMLLAKKQLSNIGLVAVIEVNNEYSHIK